MKILRLAQSLGSKVSSIVVELFWNTESSNWNDLNRNWND
tara:strand:- start:92 stop:211 length:120 start_codon:yes stop_codon:yes gene_type:complete